MKDDLTRAVERILFERIRVLQTPGCRPRIAGKVRAAREIRDLLAQSRAAA